MCGRRDGRRFPRARDKWSDAPDSTGYFFGVAGTGFGSINGVLAISTRATPLGAEETIGLLIGRLLGLVYLYHV